MKRFEEPTAEDAGFYMEICYSLINRLGGHVVIEPDEYPWKPFDIMYRLIAESEGGPGIEIVCRQDIVG